MRFLTPYYISNFLILLSYPALLRPFVIPAESDLYSGDSMLRVSRELQLLLSIAVLLALKGKNSPSMDGFLFNVFLFSKLFMAVALAVDSFLYAGLFIAATLVLAISFPQPTYSGPSKVSMLKGATLNSSVLADRTGTYHILLFVTYWAPPCSAFIPVFARLSNALASPSLKFWMVNITNAEPLARKFLIDTSTSSKQLPTLILFKDGVELSRLPAFVDQPASSSSAATTTATAPASSRRVVPGAAFDANSVVEYFDLESACDGAPALTLAAPSFSDTVTATRATADTGAASSSTTTQSRSSAGASTSHTKARKRRS